ncbi:hypothetical protein ACQ4M4_13175 [Leptolyngbya sp. AN02str]|uniref:hypothetical protein n=1 Tax=Leptolyngbya sp. AN02str TaxID=3423363 RepID=UPI003D319A00
MINRFPLLTREGDRFLIKNVLTCLTIWLVLEVIALVLLPGLGLTQPGDRIPLWLAISIPVGLVGAVLQSIAPRLIARSRQTPKRSSRRTRVLASRALGWLGMVGIAFPLFIITFETVYWMLRSFLAA